MTDAAVGSVAVAGSTDYARLVAPENYVRARKLSRETMKQWSDAIAAAVPARPVRTALDLGCGTGRFSVLLAKCLRAAVLGVDPSAAMLAEARRTPRKGVRFLRGRAERIPLGDRAADFVFVSQIWHHLVDEARAADEMRRVLSPGGRVCVRNSTIEDIGSYLYVRFFPGARRAFLRRMPRRQRIIGVMKRAGLRFVRLKVVRQSFAESPRVYSDRIGRRALFDLAGLDNRQFRQGMDRLSRHCRRLDQSVPVTERMDFFVFERRLSEPAPIQWSRPGSARPRGGHAAAPGHELQARPGASRLTASGFSAV